MVVILDLIQDPVGIANPFLGPGSGLLMTHNVTLPALSEAEVSGSEGPSSGKR